MPRGNLTGRERRPNNLGNQYVPQQPLSAVTGSLLYPQPYVPHKPEGMTTADWLASLNAPVAPPAQANKLTPLKDFGNWAKGLPELDFNTLNEKFLQWLGNFNKYDDVEALQGGGGSGSIQYPSVGKMASPADPKLSAPPEYAVAESGDTWETLAERLGFDFDPTMLAAMNPDITAPTAGSAINLPDVSKQPPTLTPDPKVHLETAAPIPTEFGDIVYPEGWNMAKLQAAIYGGGGIIDFASKFYGGDYTTQPGEKPPHPYESMTMEYATTHPEEAQRMYEDYKASGVPTEELPAWPGLPSSHAWEKNIETGEWVRKPHEAVFDELYVMNGIDPTDPDQVEWFWSLADDDLLFAGELFDVIEWGEEPGGYGGYGNMPTPSRQYGSGQKPTRGDYATYLGLSSWSI